MLFSGSKACFSPSVSRLLLRAWVNNGGTLTHSAQEFRQADYFFCCGTSDPWTTERLSRSLIVLHATWVTKSLSEKFVMPVAKYVLDDFFDPAQVEEDEVALQVGVLTNPQTCININRTTDAKNSSVLLPKTSQASPELKSRKRKVDSTILNNGTDCNNLAKKARFALPVDTDNDTTLIDPDDSIRATALTKTQPDLLKDISCSTKIIGLVGSSGDHDSDRRTALGRQTDDSDSMKFKRLIKPSPKDDPRTAVLLKTYNQTSNRPQNSRVASWIDSLKPSASSRIPFKPANAPPDRRLPLKVSIEQLLSQNSPVASTLFVKDRLYGGKCFKCLVLAND